MENQSGFSIKDIMRLAQSPAGQQLIALLQQQNSAAVAKAMASATAGDYDTARSALSAALESPEIRALLEQLGR